MRLMVLRYPAQVGRPQDHFKSRHEMYFYCTGEAAPVFFSFILSAEYSMEQQIDMQHFAKEELSCGDIIPSVDRGAVKSFFCGFFGQF